MSLKGPEMPVLVARGVCKAFPGVRALDGVDLDLRAGEIHALMGENGAGKSTLIKVLTGVHRPDGGRIRLGNCDLACGSPAEAEAVGISTVYQEVNLVGTLSVAENIVLGRQPTRWGMVDWGAARARARVALERVGLALDVRQDLGGCPMAAQQLVAIARALDVKAKVLILDEPTSSLDERECDRLFGVLRRLRSEGMAILFVTHFLDQVYAVSDRITVLRNGTRVGEYLTSELPRLELIKRMLGREEATRLAPDPDGGAGGAASKPAVLEVKGLESRGRLKPVDLTVERGEVLGLAGLLGSGRTELARLLFGIDSADAGSMQVGGRPVRLGSPREAIRNGLGFCSEDRKTEGVVPNLGVRENLLLALQAKRGVWHRLGEEEQREWVDRFVRALGIKTPTMDTPIRSLSGGNQQKVLLARWLVMNPVVLILDEPTRGIDVGAKGEIEALVERLREEGLAVVFISSELEEIVRVSGRVAVMRDRVKIRELSGRDVNEGAILEAIAR